MFIRCCIAFGEVLPYASFTLRDFIAYRSRFEFANNMLFCLRPFYPSDSKFIVLLGRGLIMWFLYRDMCVLTSTDWFKLIPSKLLEMLLSFNFLCLDWLSLFLPKLDWILFVIRWLMPKKVDIWYFLFSGIYI